MGVRRGEETQYTADREKDTPQNRRDDQGAENPVLLER